MKRFKKILSKNVLIIAIFVILLATMAMMFSYIGKLRENLQAKNDIIEAQNTSTKMSESISTEIDLQMLENEVKEIGELATIDFHYMDAASFSSAKQIKNFNIPLTTKSFVVRWSGEIKAGIDVEEIHFEINKPDKKIIVSLPPSKILSHEIEPDSMETIDEKSGAFNKITVNDVTTAIEDSKRETEKRAQQYRLLDDATRSAERLIYNFLNTNTNIRDRYEIEVTTRRGRKRT